MHDLVVRNAKCLVDGQWILRDFSVDEEKLSSFSPGDAKLDTDAQGLICLPGAIDTHVHFNEPGRTHWEGFATGTLAAAAGGITTVVEMPLNSIPSTVSVADLNTKLSAIGTQSHVDFALWGGLVPGNVDQLQPLSDAGVAGFKAFMSPSGTNDFENSDIETLRAGMAEIAKTGKRLAIHAEDPATLEAVKVASKVTALDWERSRPVAAELNAVRIAIDLSLETSCPIHIVHVSSPEVLELIQEAKRSGVEITCETCPHYLLLSIEDAAAIGPNAKCAPPLRPRKTVDAFWNSLRHGLIDTLGTDHSPSPPDLKLGKSFFDAWGGISGIQHGFPLLWQTALSDTALLDTLLRLGTLTPSRLFAFSEKGGLKVGKDADFVLLQESAVGAPIEASQLLTRHKQSAYERLKLDLQVRETWLRGKRIISDGKPCGAPSGRFIQF